MHIHTNINSSFSRNFSLLNLTSAPTVISKIKTVIREKEGHYIITKGSVQEDTTMVNIYARNTGAPQYIRQMLANRKGEMDSNTIIVGDLNTSLTSTDRSSTGKINKEV